MSGGLERVVEALASQCDGARVRDGRGFSRADAQEGARLSAMHSAGIPWSQSDAKRALEMAGRHPMQAAALLAGGDEKKQHAIAAALRAGKVMPASAVPDAEQKPYNLASLSSGGRSINFWRMSWIDSLDTFLAGLRAISGLRHGQRRVRVTRNDKAEMTMNGARKRIQRWEVPFNGTVLPHAIALAAAHGFAIDPAVKAGPDPLVDSLRRSLRACWVVSDGSDRHAVFDLDGRDAAFSDAVKSSLRGRFSCSPADDWNWKIELDASTRERVLDLVRRFGFAADPAL